MKQISVAYETIECTYKYKWERLHYNKSHQLVRKTTITTKGSNEPVTSVVEYISGEDYKHSLKDVVLFSPELLESCRRKGYRVLFENEEYHLLVDNPFTFYREGHKLVLLDRSCERLSDLNGKALPMAIYFSYLNGNMDNWNYDLDKTKKYLKNRQDISELSPIEDIFHMNQSRHCNKCITFKWQPNTEEYRRIYTSLPIQGKYINPHSKIFELDLLGLRASGCAKHNTYYRSGPSYDEFEG